MSRIGTRIRALLLCAMLLAGFAGGNVATVAAQSDDIDPELYESELSGIEVEARGDFAIYQAEIQEYRHGQGEVVSIGSNTAYVQVSFFDDTDTNQETLDIYNESFSSDVDNFEILDAGDDRDTVYSFALAEYEGVEFYYYLAVTEDVVDNVDILQRIFATDATFFEDFADAQDAITVDGDAFLGDVDVADLEDVAGAQPNRPVDDDPTEEATEEPTEEATEEPVEAAPTIDPAGATVRDLQVVQGQLVASPDVEVGAGAAKQPGYEEIPMQLGESQATLLLLLRPESPEATLDFVLQFFTPENGTRETIGTDASRTTAWSMDLLNDNGEEIILFVEVRNDRFNRYHYAEILLAPVGNVQESMDAFGENVQIDGIPMFSQADRETISFLLDGGEDPNERASATEEAGTDDKNNQNGGEPTEEATGLDLESQGLVSESEYESPQHGVLVEWDESVWGIDPEWEMTAVSDEESGIDSVILFWLNGNASMMIQIMPSDGSEPADFVGVWESNDYMAESVHEDAEVLLSDSGRNSGGVIYLTYDAEGQELILAQEVIYIDDDTVAIVTMFSSPADIVDAYADAEDLVAVDDNDAAGTFTPREIEGALE